MAGRDSPDSVARARARVRAALGRPATPDDDFDEVTQVLRVAALESRIASIDRRLDSLERRLTQVEGGLSRPDNRIGWFEERLTALQQRVTTLADETKASPNRMHSQPDATGPLPDPFERRIWWIRAFTVVCYVLTGFVLALIVVLNFRS